MSSYRCEGSEQNFLMAELESLGLSTIRLNELNDNYELRGLVARIKHYFLERIREHDGKGSVL